MSEIKLLSNNERKVFKGIFNKYYQPLYHLSSYYLEDEDESKEVVQEAFVKLWEIRHELNIDSNLRNFLFTLVKNSSLNILKRRQIHLKHHEKIRGKEIQYQYDSLSKINVDYLELDELKGKIEMAIKNLPENCRIVFEMSRFQEMKYHEIAKKLEISKKAVEARMTKALKILRIELKDYLPIFLIVTSFFD